MKCRRIPGVFLFFGALLFSAFAAPVIDPIPNASIPAGKSLILPVTASFAQWPAFDLHGHQQHQRIAVVSSHQQSVLENVRGAGRAGNAPGAFQTPFRGGMATVTNVGDMTFMLFRDIAPHTVNVFQGLTAGGIYTSNTIFHRVIPGFVIQGGDPQHQRHGRAGVSL